MANTKPVICRFYRLIEDAPDPERADRSADGTLPMIAYSYCEAITSASGFGWYFYPPISFSLVWDGREIGWSYDGGKRWEPLRAAPYPSSPDAFAKLAPSTLADLEPSFLSQGKLPGVVQIWSGYLAQTAPGWALLSRGVANRAPTQPVEEHELLADARDDQTENAAYANYEGIVETDSWFGPLFTNVRLMRINSPVDFHVNRPFFQVQPILRQCYRDPGFAVLQAHELGPEDWHRFEATMRPNRDDKRRPGHYAADTRRRLRREDNSK
jgi:hypothetical protein